MPSSPPGEPSSNPDPWAEQARRRAAHRARRRRRRLVWAGLLAVAAVAAAGVLWALTGDDPGRAVTTASSARATSTAPSPATTVAATAPPPSTVAPEAVVRLDEVWLLDRQDGTFDWGLIVASTDDADREGVTVTARLIADSGEVIEVLLDEIGVLPAGERVAVGGVVLDPPERPVRLEADVAVGRVVAESVDGGIEVRAVERRADVRGGDGEVLTGRLTSTMSVEVGPVRLAAIWRDEAGAVVAVAFHDVERVRPLVDARFEVPLAGLVVPDGAPAEVLVAR